MPTGAMEPTISEGGTVLVDVDAYKESAVARWDLVVFTAPESVRNYTADVERLPPYVMRIIGLPGETIDFSKQQLLVDGAPLTLPAALSKVNFIGLNDTLRTGRRLPAPEQLKLGVDEYFIMGDNTRSSLDSRYWGALPKKHIVGKVTKLE